MYEESALFFFVSSIMSFVKQNPRDVLKLCFDYFFAVLFLIILLPVILILSIVIFMSDGGPVLFLQERCGMEGRIFRLYKFRSMKKGSDSGLPLLSGKNDKRITPVGRFMRKHRLDEIPNFLNVIRGEMSLVGPRPEQPYFTDLLLKCKPAYDEISKVKPGITSWGLVQYGYASNLEQLADRADFDIEYVRNRSFCFDIKIIFLTIGIIIRGEGV